MVGGNGINGAINQPLLKGLQVLIRPQVISFWR